MSATVSSTGVAGRYASALFDLAKDAGGLDRTEADLQTLKGAIDASADLRRAIRSPVIDKAARGRAIAAIAERLGLSDLVRNFLGVLTRNARLFALPHVIPVFSDLLAEHRGEARALATTAVALDAERIQRLKTEIEAAVGRAVRLETAVDESLLGGLVVKVGSTMIDSSLKTKLQRMKTAMKGA